ncbi:MAG TPA: hypothetical protein VNA25_14745 [Phycisphaerae bacterium]|nr:hypothetical protein [Phycisphaerae bacterium]
MAKILPYATPPFKAVRLHCNRCDASLDRDSAFRTQACRDIEARNKGGEWIFCEGCEAKFEQESVDIEARLAALREKHAEELSELSKELWLEAIEGSRPRAPSSSKVGKGQSSTAPKPARRRGGATIPNPREVNGQAD